MEIRKRIEKNYVNKNWFFLKINKTDKPLVRLTKKKKREQTQTINERGDSMNTI